MHTLPSTRKLQVQEGSLVPCMGIHTWSLLTTYRKQELGKPGGSTRLPQVEADIPG